MKSLKEIFSCCLSRLEIVRAACFVLLMSRYSILGAQTISSSEYFFDSDPGMGNGIPLTISTPGDTVTFPSIISTTGLAGGRHLFYIRTRTSTGNWSLYEPREFFIQVPISRAEYFFDTDPGIGNATPLPINTTVDDFTFNTTVPVTLLPDGDHYLFIRAKDETGSWSLYEPKLFTVDGSLPVQLTSFSAKRNGQAVDIFWNTASEINNDYFEVERSISDDATAPNEFLMIDRVQGHGTTSMAHAYQSSDSPHTKAGTVYYRLRQVDMDGKSTYSNVATVIFNPSGTIIKLYPNPTSGWFTLEVEGKNQDEVTVTIFDVSGRQIESYEKTDKPLLFGKDWIPGIYLVNIMKPDGALVLKVVKGSIGY